MVRKDVYKSLLNLRWIEKAHKYIYRYKKGDDYVYIYPRNIKNKTHNGAKKELVEHVGTIKGIQPLDDFSDKSVDNQFDRLRWLSEHNELICPALGRDNIIINEMSTFHTEETNGKLRDVKERESKLKYLPFVEHILKHGKLIEKSKNGKLTTYGIGGKVEYFDKEKQKYVTDYVEVAIGYDKNANKYYLSTASKPIKKSLTEKSERDCSFITIIELK